ncbi:Btz domain containing protein, partial [Quillaja saponaria]
KALNITLTLSSLGRKIAYDQMSRREARESDSGRHRSRFDREPSPKRSRRDGKPETDRVKTGTNHDNRDLGQKHRRQLQDTLPLGSDTPLARNSKQENGTAKKDSDMKPDKQYDGTKHSSAPTEVSRSRSYSQHHERGSGGQVGRSSGRRATGERGSWKDSTDWHIEKAERATHDREQRDERSHAKVENISSRHNDGISERKDDVLPTTKKRPAFREKKIVVDPGNAEAAASETLKSNQIDRPVERSD